MVASPSKPFSYTAKHTPRRQAIINEYETEIRAIYEAVEESTQSSITVPEKWDVASVTQFVREVLSRVLLRTIDDGDDIFQNGCDRYAPVLIA